MFEYPSTSLDDLNGNAHILGTHWSQSYADKSLITSLLTARAGLEKQTFSDAVDTASSLSRQNLPLLHRREWTALVIKQSDSARLAPPLHYGDGAFYGTQSDGKLYRYGESLPSTNFYADLPADLVEVGQIYNRIKAPTVALIAGLDFHLDQENSLLVFSSDPFSNPLFSSLEIFENGEVVDRECILWLFNGAYDQHNLYKKFGYVVDVTAASTESGREIVNSVFDGLVQGTAKDHIGRLVQAATAIDFAAGTETVEVVKVDAGRRLIITDKQVYSYHVDATPLVSVGSIVKRGQSLVDTVQLIEFNRGQLPTDILAITAGKDLLSSGYIDGVTFENKDVPLLVSTDPAGYTRVEFQLGGLAADVQHFWDSVHSAGVASGTTFAQLLDQRRPTITATCADDIVTYPQGQPGPENLPSTINPLKFFVENVLRNNAFLLNLKIKHLPADSNLRELSNLRKLIPPHTCLLVIMELAATTDRIILEEAGNSEKPGCQESVELFVGLSPIADSLDPSSLIQESLVQLHHISGYCA